MPNGGIIYALGAEGTSLVKIGCTTGTVEKRMKALQTGHPFALHVLAAVPVETDVQRIERQVHAFLAEEHRRGEWFDIALDAASLVALVVRAVRFVQQQDEAQVPKPPPRILRGLGKEIRKARIEKDLTQLDLEVLTGIAFRHLSAIERGDIDPRWTTVLKLAHALDLNLDGVAQATRGDQQEVTSGPR